MNEWTSIKDGLPNSDCVCRVMRDAGIVSNPRHKGYPSGKWEELTTFIKQLNIFTCDLMDTGMVTHWAITTELPKD